MYISNRLIACVAAIICTAGAGVSVYAHDDCKNIAAAPVSVPPPSLEIASETALMAASAPRSVLPQTDRLRTGAVRPIGSAPVYVAQAQDALESNTTMVLDSSLDTGAIKADKNNIVTPTDINAPWAKILKSYTRQDKQGLVRFNYAGLSGNVDDMASLGTYIDDLSKSAPSTMSPAQEIAYWANLYNALTVQVVAENYPVESIREIKSGLFKSGPWGLQLVEVEGKSLTLDNIEHDIMREKFTTPLVHYMVNCASVGCPNLKPTPWTAAGLQEDQQSAARAFINSPRGAMLDGGRLQVSSIYNWFDEDFGGNETGVIAHLRKYATGQLSTALAKRDKIDKYRYNWDLNE